MSGAEFLNCKLFLRDEDRCSGTVSAEKRPGLTSALKALRSGDVLVIRKLDRAGRSLRDLVNMVHSLEERGIGLRVLTGAPIDTTTPAGKLIFGIFSSLAEFERSLIQERVTEGLKAARARGRVGGRPMVMTRTKVRLAQAALRDRKTVVSELCKELGVSTQTLYRCVGPAGELRPAGEKLVNRKKG